jgi:hypothetical protein
MRYLLLLALLASCAQLTEAQKNCTTDAECEAAYGFDMYGNTGEPE